MSHGELSAGQGRRLWRGGPGAHAHKPMKGTRVRLHVSALVLFPIEDEGDSVVRLKRESAESNKQNKSYLSAIIM